MYGVMAPLPHTLSLCAQEIFIIVQFLTNFGVPQYEIFLVLLSLPPSQVRIFSLVSLH